MVINKEKSLTLGRSRLCKDANFPPHWSHAEYQLPCSLKLLVPTLIIPSTLYTHSCNIFQASRRRHWHAGNLLMSGTSTYIYIYIGTRSCRTRYSYCMRYCICTCSSYWKCTFVQYWDQLSSVSERPSRKTDRIVDPLPPPRPEGAVAARRQTLISPAPGTTRSISSFRDPGSDGPGW